MKKTIEEILLITDNSLISVCLFALISGVIFWLLNKRKLCIKEVFTERLSIENEMCEDGYTHENIIVKKSEIYKVGCVLSAFISNPTNETIAISKYSFVIQKIESILFEKIDILAIVKQDVLCFYLINNGNKVVKDIKINFSFSYNTNNLALNKVAKLLQGDEEHKFAYEIDEICEGQIIQFGTCTINKNCYNGIIDKDPFITILANIEYEMVKRKEEFVGHLVLHEEHFIVIFIQGGGSTLVKRTVDVSTDMVVPYRIEMETEFSIGSKEECHLKTTIFAKSSCKLTFYLKIKGAGRKEKDIPMCSSKIFVPIYQEENLYMNLRQWIITNDIGNYRLHENLRLEQDILYQLPKH